MTAVADQVGTQRTTELAARLRAAIGAERVLTDRAQVRTYE
jgi:glycolate oxidase